MRFYLKAILIVAGLISAAAAAYNMYAQQQRSAFLRDLRGEIVFMRRGGGDFYNIYKISANGQNEKLVFTNDNKVNASSMEPRWSEDGSRIIFRAMKDGEWKTFNVNTDGGDLRITEAEKDTATHAPAEENLKIEAGNLYALESDGRTTLLYGANAIIQDRVFAPGAVKAAWSPDKQHVIFESGHYGWHYIMIAGRDGKNAVSLTEGSHFDWK